MARAVNLLRSIAFYAGYIVATVGWGALSVLVGWAIPYRARFTFVIGAWTRMVLAWLRVTCGIRPEVQGIEHLSVGPCVLLVKHQSTWETLFVQTLVGPQATLIKRELLRIPFFGWAFALLKPIAIDRRRRVGAFKQLIDQGRARLDDGIWVTLFPEGTRLEPGRTAPFQRGGAALAVAADKPVIVIAHDAGSHWPARSFIKTPGTIHVRISEPITTTDKTSVEVNDSAERWLAAAMADLEGSAAATGIPVTAPSGIRRPD